VGTPNLESRYIQFREKLDSYRVSGDDRSIKTKAKLQYREFLESVWEKDPMFMNHLEGLQYASACAIIVESGMELSHEAMHSILSNQAAVMSVRDAARDEYIASMQMSRL